LRDGQPEWYGISPSDQVLWTNTAGNFPAFRGQAQPYAFYSYNDFGELIYRDRKAASSEGGAPTEREGDFTGNSAGRLVSAKQRGLSGGSDFGASYAPDGERLTKRDSVTGYHVYSFGLEDWNGTIATNASRRTLHTPGLSFRSGISDSGTGGTDRYYRTDFLGSTRYLTDGTGAASPAAMRFDAYGRRLSVSRADAA